MDIAPFQADPSIADVAIKGGCEAILSGDSDFSMYIGPGGPDNLGDIMIRDIKINQKQLTIIGGALVTGQVCVAGKIEEILSNRGPGLVFPVHPKFPLFDGVDNSKMRALIAIALGCDALPGGVPGLGASSLYNLLQKCQPHPMMHVDFAGKLCDQRKAVVKDPLALLCMVNSLLCEKTNSDDGYMFEVPQILEKYNSAFAAPETKIIEGPNVIECKGCNGGAHSFLEAEGVSLCRECHSSLCRFCVWVDDTKESGSFSSTCCLDCMRCNLGVIGETNQLTEQEMRAFLKGHAVNVPACATYAKVLMLFQHYDEDENAIFTEDISTVRYPILPTSSLNPTNKLYSKIERIKMVKMNKIGELISSTSIDAGSVFGFVQLLASLTDIQPKNSGTQLTYKHVVPQNLLKMATNARVHSGERLIKRGLWHATDLATPSIFDGSITLGRYEDETCIVIENRVRASMKDEVYTTKAALTKTHFVASECNCKAGCSNTPSASIAHTDVGQGRIICSHGMTIPVAMSLALYKSLAGHILSELRFRLKREDFEDAFDKNQLTLFRQNITCLLKAAGKTDTMLEPSRSIQQCLDMFAVGTDLPKPPPSPPNPRDLGLLREKCRYESPTMKAEKAISHKDECIIASSNIKNASLVEQCSSANFFSVQQSVDALSLVFGMPEFKLLVDNKSASSEKKTFVGESHTQSVPCDQSTSQPPIAFRLLYDRASDQIEGQEYNERCQATEKIASHWKFALSELMKQRRHPCWKPLMGTMDSVTDEVEDNNGQTGQSKKRMADELMNVSSNTHHICCCVKGCAGSTMNAVLKRVPDYPFKLTANASEQRQRTYYKKVFIREERTERMGLGRQCNRSNLRACKEHWQEVTGKSVRPYISHNDGSVRQEYIGIKPFMAPVYVGKQSFGSPPETRSRGNARDRATLRHLAEIRMNSLALSQQQLLEMNDVECGQQHLSAINDSVLVAAGLDVHKDLDDRTTTQQDDGCGEMYHMNDLQSRVPTLELGSLMPKEVRRLTGFHDLKLLLSYVTVICDGDLNSMVQTISSMTWLEEWILYLEFIWGHSMQRLEDYSAAYQCRIKTIRKVVRSKLLQSLSARDRWPMYASYAEDAMFRDEKWNSHFDKTTGHRVVMHDSTNIPMATPNDAALQRALYNSYYGMCCAKAGVAVQLCGWIHGLPLNTGHSDDTRFIADTNILAKQKEFADSDTSSDKPFLNVFDKGYLCTLMASEHGQTCLQPAFAEFEKQFAANTTLYSGAVAVVRSGNERAVKRCKMSWVLKRGAKEQMWDVDFLCDVWDAWTFQVNFMFDKFL